MNGTAIAAYTVEHGGGTFDVAGRPVEPANGYAVGMSQGSAAILPLTVSPDTLASTMLRIAQEFEASFVGTWVATDEAGVQRIYVDPVRILTHFVSAIGAAERYGQRAIFGFAEGHAIEVM